MSYTICHRRHFTHALTCLALAAIATLCPAKQAACQSQSTVPRAQQKAVEGPLETVGPWELVYTNGKDAKAGIDLLNRDQETKKALLIAMLKPGECRPVLQFALYGTELAGLTKIDNLEVNARADEGVVYHLTGDFKRQEWGGYYILHHKPNPEWQRALQGLDKARFMRVQVKLPSGEKYFRFDLSKCSLALSKAGYFCKSATESYSSSPQNDAGFFENSGSKTKGKTP